MERTRRVSFRPGGGRWAGLFGLALLAATPTASASGPVVSDRPVPSTTAPATPLEARIEALERQNAALLEMIQAGVPTQPQPVAPDADPSYDVAPVPSLAGRPTPPAPASAPAPPNPLGMTARWNSGLELTSDDKDFRIHVGGRTQVDAVFLDGGTPAFQGAGGIGDQDSVNLRRGRFRIDGTMYEIIDFACEYDFVNTFNNDPTVVPATEATTFAAPAVTDLWVNVAQVPLVGNVKVGNFKEPIGFDHLTSSRFLNFLERSFNQDAYNGAFNNGFSPGIQVGDTYLDERGTWATGIFKNASNIFAYGVGDAEYAWTSRATGLLMYDDSCGREDLVHVGLAGSLRDTNNGAVQYRSRGSLRNGPPGPLNPVFANTGPFAADRAGLLDAELSVQRGSLLVNAEYEANWNYDAFGNGVSAPAGADLGTVTTNGWYVEALYFLTGEHRDYDTKAGVYGRVIPLRNFNWGKGPGAWQVGARYSQLDLDDGGLLSDTTLGLNWFLNPNLKFQWNYAYTDRGPAGAAPGGPIHGAGMRLAFDF